MKFKELMDEVLNDEGGIDYFIIEMARDLVPDLVLMNEGAWTKSNKDNWMSRVDAGSLSMNILQHVHVAKLKHISTKHKQVSWNKDRTRHDKKNFNSKIGSLKSVQLIAKRALGLPDNVKLEKVSKIINNSIQLDESIRDQVPIFCLKET